MVTFNWIVTFWWLFDSKYEFDIFQREKFIETVWSHARALVNNSVLEDGQTDIKPEVLYFWMRGYSSTEPGEFNQKYLQSEPCKYQSVCQPEVQHRLDSPLQPFESLENCIEATHKETIK